MKKAIGLLLIFTMMIGSSINVLAAEPEKIFHQKDILRFMKKMKMQD